MSETNYGEALARVRRQAGATQARLAEVLGRGSHKYFSDIERGRRPLHELTPLEVDALVVGLGFGECGPEAESLRTACYASYASRNPWARELWVCLYPKEPHEVFDLEW